MSLPIVELRPKTRLNALLLAVGCLAFTAAGLAMIVSGDSEMDVLVGALSVAFFGGGGLYALPTLLRRTVSIVLRPESFEQRYPQGSAFIPWEDIDQVGVVSIFGSKLTGFRLKSYDRYLESMTPALNQFLTKRVAYMKPFARVTSLLSLPLAASVWGKLAGHDVAEGLKKYGGVGDLAESMLWSREQFGYDLFFSWSDLDRPASEFIALVEKYRAAAQGK